MELSAMPSLEHLTPAQLEELHDACQESRLEPGDELIRRGDEGGKY